VHLTDVCFQTEVDLATRTKLLAMDFMASPNIDTNVKLISLQLSGNPFRPVGDVLEVETTATASSFDAHSILLILFSFTTAFCFRPTSKRKKKPNPNFNGYL